MFQFNNLNPGNEGNVITIRTVQLAPFRTSNVTAFTDNSIK